jgi:hypothetical protein
MLAGMGVPLPEGKRAAGEALDTLLGAGSGGSPPPSEGTPASALSSPRAAPPPPLGAAASPSGSPGGPTPPPSTHHPMPAAFPPSFSPAPAPEAQPCVPAGGAGAPAPPPRARNVKCLGCALDDLMAVDSMLTDAVGFWAHMELVIDLVIRRKELSETLLSATSSSQAMVTKTQATLHDYNTFWQVFKFLCDTYGLALQEQTVPMFAWLNNRGDDGARAPNPGLFALTN